MSCCVSPWVYPVCDSLCLLDLIDYFLFHVGEIFNYNLFKNFLIPFIFLFFFWDPYNSNVGAFNIVPGSLPISSSFIWTSVFLVCSFICVVFLCLFITFLTYYDWGLLFPGFKVEFFFFSLWFLPSRVRFLLSLCFFAFPLMGRAEWGGNSVCWWLGLYFCFVCCLDEAQGATGGWVMLVLSFKWFPLCEFSLFDTP